MMIREESIIRSSTENIIDQIKEHRNDFIKRLLNTEFLITYLIEELHSTNPSSIKLEFIKRSLKELESSVVDLSHYAALILETRRKGSLSISKNTEQYFRMDVERTIKNYL